MKIPLNWRNYHAMKNHGISPPPNLPQNLLLLVFSQVRDKFTEVVSPTDL